MIARQAWRRLKNARAVAAVASLLAIFVQAVAAQAPNASMAPTDQKIAVVSAQAVIAASAPAVEPPVAPVIPPVAPNPNAVPPAFEPSPIPLGNGLQVGGALDLRARNSASGRTGGVYVNSAEIDLQHAISSGGRTRGNIVLQLIAEDPPDIHDGQDIQIGEAYVLYQLPIHWDSETTTFLKVGQFQVPFGLLAVYDPHLKIIQPLYSDALGVRTDFGIALSGTLYGHLQYDASLTTGSGPNHADVDPNRLVTLRLGRTFDTRNGLVNFGGSLLSGRLPVTDLDAADPFAVELPPSGRVRANRLDTADKRFTPKTRIAIDATYKYKSIVGRGEAIAGADRDHRVQGYFGEANYNFTRRAAVTGAYSVFVYPQGNSTNSIGSAGMTYSFSRKVSASAIYQYLRDVPRDAGAAVRHRFTVQMLMRF